jgi:phosphate transport system protein
MSTDSRHILGVFEDAINNLKADIRQMGDIAQRSLGHAMQGLYERNPDLCNRTIADDDEVDELQKKIDREGIEIMVKYSPVARNLRRVVATMKVSTALERITDHAVSLARRARQIMQHPATEEVEGIRGIHELVAAQLKDSVDSFCNGDLELALRIQGRDDEIDAAYKAFHRDILARMEQNPVRIREHVDALFITSLLERIGDQSVNISEDAVYLLTAYDIRHGGERPPADAQRRTI